MDTTFDLLHTGRHGATRTSEGHALTYRAGTDRSGSPTGGVRTLPWYAILTTPVGDLPKGEDWSRVVSGSRGHAIGERALESGRVS